MIESRIIKIRLLVFQNNIFKIKLVIFKVILKLEIIYKHLKYIKGGRGNSYSAPWAGFDGNSDDFVGCLGLSINKILPITQQNPSPPTQATLRLAQGPKTSRLVKSQRYVNIILLKGKA